MSLESQLTALASRIALEFSNLPAAPSVPNVAGKKVLWSNNTSGTLTGLAYSTAATANAIPQRIASGHITLPITPTTNTHAASKYYVDAQVNTKSKIIILTASASVPGGTSAGTIIVRTP